MPADNSCLFHCIADSSNGVFSDAESCRARIVATAECWDGQQRTEAPGPPGLCRHVDICGRATLTQSQYCDYCCHSCASSQGASHDESCRGSSAGESTPAPTFDVGSTTYNGVNDLVAAMGPSSFMEWCDDMRQSDAWGDVAVLGIASAMANAMFKVYERRVGGHALVASVGARTAKLLIRLEYAGRSHYNCLLLRPRPRPPPAPGAPKPTPPAPKQRPPAPKPPPKPTPPAPEQRPPAPKPAPKPTPQQLLSSILFDSDDAGDEETCEETCAGPAPMRNAHKARRRQRKKQRARESELQWLQWLHG